MPDCPHCHKYYFGNPAQCPNCNFDFKTGKILSREEISKERQKQQDERNKQLETERQKQEKELQKQWEERAKRSLIINSSGRYEYATEYLRDSSNGILDKSQLDSVLKKYSEEGWRLHSVFTNEAGKNASSTGIGGLALGSNSTIDITILIFERCIKLPEF